MDKRTVIIYVVSNIVWTSIFTFAVYLSGCELHRSMELVGVFLAYIIISFLVNCLANSLSKS